MKPRWIVKHVGVGEHEYEEAGREGPFPSMLDALAKLVTEHGGDWVDENVLDLVASQDDGCIAWITDDLGYSIEDSPTA